MSQDLNWFTKASDSSPKFKRRFQRVAQIISHPHDAWLVIRLVAWSFVLPLLKRMIPLKKLAPWMWSRGGKSTDRDLEQKIAAVVRWIYIFIFPNEKSCLERSLLLYRFLSGCKREPCMVTGMRRTEDGKWKGHAWIEIDGIPFEEATTHTQDFRALILFGPEGAMTQAKLPSTEITQ